MLQNSTRTFGLDYSIAPETCWWRGSERTALRCLQTTPRSYCVEYFTVLLFALYSACILHSELMCSIRGRAAALNAQRIRFDRHSSVYDS